MVYTQAQISKIIQKIIAKARHELELAENPEGIVEIMDKYGVTLEEEAIMVSPRRSKILVFGALAGNVNDYKIAAKKMGIPSENIVFETDYDRLHRYDTAKLEYTDEYSDIIYGPAPHKTEGMGDTSSLLAKIEKEPNKYPRLYKCSANGGLKISIHNFKDALSRTRYFEAI